MGRSKKLKVYGTMTSCPQSLRDALNLKSYPTQARAVVAATSRIAAAKLLGVGRDHIAETGNMREIEAALSQPGTIFYTSCYGHAQPFFKEAQP